MKKIIVLLALMAVAIGPSIGARADSILIGEDEIGDWGANVDTTVAPIGDALGGDLKSASIDNSTPGLVKFILGVTYLPSQGGTPEVMRYNWSMKVGTQHVELDGKYTNYSRGTCDPTAGTCPPPRDPGSAPFIVRGNCASNGAVNVCQEFALVHATFDVASATITIPVPLSALGVTGCTNITPDINATSFPDGNIVTVPSAYVSQANLPTDYLLVNDDSDVEVC
jgi:hypothetical protein